MSPGGQFVVSPDISDKHTDGERIYRLAAPATPAEAAGNDA